MNTYSNIFASRMQGDDVESAYANVFAGHIVGGIEDGGLDVSTGDTSIPFVQVKSSIKGLMTFLAESLRRNKFIPVCVGEPGNRDEMIRHLNQFGAWIGMDIPGRVQMLTAVQQVRSLCTA